MNAVAIFVDAVDSSVFRYFGRNFVKFSSRIESANSAYERMAARIGSSEYYIRSLVVTGAGANRGNHDAESVPQAGVRGRCLRFDTLRKKSEIAYRW